MIFDFEIDSTNKNQRLDIFLTKSIVDFSRSQIKKSIDNSMCLVNDKKEKSGYKLQQNDKIQIEINDNKSFDVSAEKIDLKIIYEDDDLAVIDKSAGLVVHPASGNTSHTLVNALKYRYKELSDVNGDNRPGIVHRLDKDTSGLMVIAKNNLAHKSLAKQIKDKTAKRIYQAIVVGNIKDDEGTIDKNLIRCKTNGTRIVVCNKEQGRRAITNYKVIERFSGYSLVEFSLLTGRTHQIRVHAKSIGHPVSADKVYGCKDKLSKYFDRQLLHAKTLIFTHPTTNKLLEYTSELPDDFKRALDMLRK